MSRLQASDTPAADEAVAVDTAQGPAEAKTACSL